MASRSPVTKIWVLLRVSREWPEYVSKYPTQGGGVLAEGCKSICVEDGVSYSGSAVVNPLPRISGRTANLNCEA